MGLRWGRGRNRVRGRWVALAGALIVVAGAVTGGIAAGRGGGGPAVRESDAMLTGAGGVRLDTSYFTTPGGGRRPAVLLAHGFGGSKDDVRQQARQLARHGYAVLTWSARGFGDSGGRIGLNASDGEVADVSRLVDWLANRPEVRLDAPGDPRVGISGTSYGGAISLLAAAYDHRVDAVAPRETYWNLADALFPDGVYKKLWTGILFSDGSPEIATGTGAAPSASPSASAPPGGTATGAAEARARPLPAPPRPPVRARRPRRPPPPAAAGSSRRCARCTTGSPRRAGPTPPPAPSSPR